MPTMATATRDHASAEGLSPAEAIWWLHAHPGPLLRLVDLPGAGLQTCQGSPS
jgi:hypothetical protein